MGLTQITTGGVDDNINIDSNTLKVDGTNNRVGIGTTSPNFALDVNGNIALTEGQVLAWHDGSGNKAGDIYMDSSDNIVFRQTSSVNERMRIDSSGRLLVGKTSTSNSHTLQVQAASGAEALSVIGRSADDQSEITFYENDNTTVLAQIQQISDRTVIRHRTGYLRFDTGGTTERMRIDSSGRLLIGTSSGGANLVIGDVNTPAFNRGAVAIKAVNDANSIPANIYLEEASGAEGYTLSIDSDGDLNFHNSGASTPTVTFSDLDRVGIGTTSPGDQLHIHTASSGAANVRFSSTDVPNGFFVGFDGQEIGQIWHTANKDIRIATNNTERMRIDSSGNVGIGTTSVSDDLHLKRTGSSAIIRIENTGNGNHSGIFFVRESSAGTSKGSANIHVESNTGGTGTALIFGCGSNTSSTGGERMRIDSSGSLLIQTTARSSSAEGCYFDASNSQQFYQFLVNNTSSSTTANLYIKRQASDGRLIEFRQADNTEGHISVSGTDVTLTGATLSRWSQPASNADFTGVLRGSVLSNTDEMCEWAHAAQDEVLYTAEDELPEGVSVGDVKTPAKAAYTEDNEQLNRMKISDVEGDRDVAGVFREWDAEEEFPDDFCCAMTGDFVIRIAQGTTVARGDLLMSAGDGTAKPQDDDIVRSKTIAKVTSTTVSTTYSDGSYCVPCVLMAC